MSKFVKGLVFGAVFGASAGLLFAPKSGKELRDTFQDELDDWVNSSTDFSDKLAQFKAETQNFQEVAVEYAQPFMEGIKQDAATFAFQAQPRLEQINEQLERMKTHLAQSNEPTQH